MASITKNQKSTYEPFLIVIPVYDGVDLMDIAAPREIFGWLATDKTFHRDVKIVYVGGGKETFTTNNGVQIVIEATFDDVTVLQPHLIWVPGGSPEALERIINDPNAPFTAYVKAAGAKATLVCL
jgi:putative intracellular protease/amidase